MMIEEQTVLTAEEQEKALEQEIIGKFEKLSPAARQRVRVLVGGSQMPDWEQWIQQADAIRATTVPAKGDDDVVSMLRELREEGA